MVFPDGPAAGPWFVEYRGTWYTFIVPITGSGLVRVLRYPGGTTTGPRLVTIQWYTCMIPLFWGKTYKVLWSTCMVPVTDDVFSPFTEK